MSLNGYEVGQQIIYKGHSAKIVHIEPCSDNVYIEYDGVCYKVSKSDPAFDYSDLVKPNEDTFTKRIEDEVISDCNKRLASSDEYIAKKEEEKNIFKKIEDAAKETEEKCCKAMAALRDRFNAKSEKGINDASKQKEYLALMNDMSQARRTKRRAIADYLTANGLIQDEIYYKADTLNTMTVVNAIANSGR